MVFFPDSEVFEFSDVCRCYLGKWGEWTAIIFALVTFLGGMIVYWVLMTNFLYTGGIFIYGKILNAGTNLPCYYCQKILRAFLSSSLIVLRSNSDFLFEI